MMAGFSSRALDEIGYMFNDIVQFQLWQFGIGMSLAKFINRLVTSGPGGQELYILSLDNMESISPSKGEFMNMP